jgi:excisionase family DNA binding protein
MRNPKDNMKRFLKAATVTKKVDEVSENSRLLSPQEAAEVLGVSYGTLQNWRSAGRGPDYVKIGAKVKYRPSEIQKFIEIASMRADCA